MTSTSLTDKLLNLAGSNPHLVSNASLSSDLKRKVKQFLSPAAKKKSFFGTQLSIEKREPMDELAGIKKVNRLDELKKDSTYLELQKQFHMDADIDNWIEQLEQKERLTTGRNMRETLALAKLDKPSSDYSFDTSDVSSDDYQFAWSPQKDGKPNHFKEFTAPKTKREKLKRQELYRDDKIKHDFEAQHDSKGNLRLVMTEKGQYEQVEVDIAGQGLVQKVALEIDNLDLYKRAQQLDKEEVERILNAPSSDESIHTEFSGSEEAERLLNEEKWINEETLKYWNSKTSIESKPADKDGGIFNKTEAEVMDKDLRKAKKKLHKHKEKEKEKCSNDVTFKFPEPEKVAEAGGMDKVDLKGHENLTDKEKKYNLNETHFKRYSLLATDDDSILKKQAQALRLVFNEHDAAGILGSSIPSSVVPSRQPSNTSPNKDRAKSQAPAEVEKKLRRKQMLPEKGRLFFKHIDGTKLFTQRYVNKMKENFRFVLNRFVVGAQYALNKQRDEIMSGSRSMVMGTHKKVTGAFETEAFKLIDQNKVLQNELDAIKEKFDILLAVNRQQEIDLALATRQQDYNEERLTADQKEEKDLTESQELIVFNADKKLQRQLSDEECSIPETPEFQWTDLTTNERYERAIHRVHLFQKETMDAPTFTHPFDFYGGYVRINHHQRYKWAETKVTMYYKDIIDEVVDKYNAMKAENETLFFLNTKLRFEATEFDKKLQAEKRNTKRAEDYVVKLTEEYEKKIQKINSEHHKEKLDDKKVQLQVVETMKAELTLAENIKFHLVNEKLKLQDEVKTLANVIQSTRLHFKEIEKADFNNLQDQIADYEKKIQELDLSENKVKEFRIKNAKRRLQENQADLDHRKFVEMAKARGLYDVNDQQLKLGALFAGDKPRRVSIPKRSTMTTPGIAVTGQRSEIDLMMIQASNKPLSSRSPHTEKEIEVVNTDEGLVTESDVNVQQSQNEPSKHSKELLEIISVKQSSENIKKPQKKQTPRSLTKKKKGKKREEDSVMTLGGWSRTARNQDINLQTQESGGDSTDLQDHVASSVSKRDLSSAFEKLSEGDSKGATLTQPASRKEMRNMKIEIQESFNKKSIIDKLSGTVHVVEGKDKTPEITNTSLVSRQDNTTLYSVPRSRAVEDPFNNTTNSFLSESITFSANRNNMPKRSPMKLKVIPNLKGVLAGNKGNSTLVDIDQFLDSAAHKKTIPKTRQTRRSESIPPLLKKQEQRIKQRGQEPQTAVGTTRNFDKRKASTHNRKLSPLQISVRGTDYSSMQKQNQAEVQTRQEVRVRDEAYTSGLTTPGTQRSIKTNPFGAPSITKERIVQKRVLLLNQASQFTTIDKTKGSDYLHIKTTSTLPEKKTEPQSPQPRAVSREEEVLKMPEETTGIFVQRLELQDSQLKKAQTVETQQSEEIEGDKTIRVPLFQATEGLNNPVTVAIDLQPGRAVTGDFQGRSMLSGTFDSREGANTLTQSKISKGTSD